MKPIEEIKKVVDEATNKILEIGKMKHCSDKHSKQFLIMVEKADTYDKIAEIMEKEEKDWWNN